MDTPENQPDFGLATTPFEAPEGWPGYHVLLSNDSERLYSMPGVRTVAA